jgi:putative ABC transport system permease protein
MIRLAWASLRSRPASMIVVLIVGLFGPILLSTAATLLTTAIVLPAPPRTFTAPVVVAGAAGFDLPDQQHQSVPFPEGSVVTDDLVAAVRADAAVLHVELYRDPDTGSAVALGARPRPEIGAEMLAQRLRSHLGADLQVLTGDQRGLAEDPGIRASRIPLVVLGAVASGIMLVIIALVASAALGLTINERRREIRVLRLVGATHRQVRRLLVVETTLAAVAAATIGALASPFVGTRVFEGLRNDGLLAPLLIPTGQRLTALIAWALTVACLSATASLIAGSAVRRAVEPDQPDLDARVPSPLRRSLALVVGATAALMLLATPFLGPEGGSSVGGPAILVAVGAVGLGAPMLIRRGLPFVRTGGRRVGLGELGSDEIGARTGRFGSVLTLLTLAVALGAGNISAAFTTADAEQPRILRASVFAEITGAGLAETQRAVTAVAGASAEVSATVSSAGWIETPYDGTGSDPLPVVGVNHAAGFVVPKVKAGSLDDLVGASIAITRDDAAALDLDVGDLVGYRFGDGATRQLRVAAVLEAGRSMRARIVSYDLLAAHVRTPTTTTLIRTELSTVRIADELAELGVGARVSASHVESADPVGSLGSLIYLAVGLAALAFAALVAMNSMIALTLARRSELWAWRLVGATRRQLLEALFIESTYIGALSAALGGVIGAAAATMIALGLGRLPSLPPLSLGAVLVVPVMLVVVAAMLAGLRATRPPA